MASRALAIIQEIKDADVHGTTAALFKTLLLLESCGVTLLEGVPSYVLAIIASMISGGILFKNVEREFEKKKLRENSKKKS